MESGPGTMPNPDYAPRPAARRLYRSSTNRVFSGVCGGIAEYWGGDPTMVRLATLFLGLITGIFPMLILYIVAAIVLPERALDAPSTPGAYARSAGRGSGTLIIGLILIVVGAIGFAHEVLRIDTDVLWPIGLIGIGAALVVLTFRR
jgi:phage shock protein C